VPVEVYAHGNGTRDLIERNRAAVERLAAVDKLTFVESALAKQAGARSTARFDVHVAYEREIDVEGDRVRLKKELAQMEKEIAGIEQRLGDQQFLSKAPANVVAGRRKRLQELLVLRDKTASKLRELG
jgi:valyl-tRNA synthetase